MTTATVNIPAPGRNEAPKRKGFNLEKWGWIYMRASGVVLAVRLFVDLVAGDGVKAIDFAFVAGKLANPFWIVWDTLLLWLALIHGANGMRTVVNDYATKPGLRRVLHALILISTALLLLLGTLVIYTFDPCPAGSPAELLPSFCEAL